MTIPALGERPRYVGHRLGELMHTLRLSLSQLAELSHLSRPTLYKILDEQREPSPEVRDQLTHAMQSLVPGLQVGDIWLYAIPDIEARLAALRTRGRPGYPPGTGPRQRGKGVVKAHRDGTR